MKHIFVINPKAGKKDVTSFVTEEVRKHLKIDEYLIYVTKGVLDAKNFVKKYCEDHLNEKIRFYSCGGDGTLNEVANGAYGFKDVEVACYPSGSGNDFIKYFGTSKQFLNIHDLIYGQTVDVDLLKYENRYILNICNVGFDADVAMRMVKYKRLPLVSGKSAYMLGVAVSFFSKLTHHFKLTVDDKVLYEGEGLLSAFANSICYGGGYYCAPNALVDDGLIDIVFVKKLRRPTFLNLIKYYKKGTHLNEPKLKKYIIYEKGKTVKIECSKLINYSIDGELGQSKILSITVEPKALKFVLPEGIK